MTQQSQKLRIHILKKLSELEKQLEEEEVIHVLPYEGHGKQDLNLISFDGSSIEDICNELWKMSREGITSSGSVRDPVTNMGIMFSHLTSAGRELLA